MPSTSREHRYILGRTDPDGRTVIDRWADSKAQSRLQSSFLTVLSMILIAHAVFFSLFAPHLATKLLGLVTAGTTQQLFEGVPNQPDHG